MFTKVHKFIELNGIVSNRRDRESGRPYGVRDRKSPDEAVQAYAEPVRKATGRRGYP